MKYEFLEELERQIEEILKRKERVLISVVGRGGTGKSYFGKYLRNNGIGKFNKRSIAVIDDGVVWFDFLFFFRRKVEMSSNEVDELRPILEKLPGSKKVIFYINATPWERISKADILLKLTTDEEVRKRRLYQRYNINSQTLKKALNSKDVDDYNIGYTYFLETKI